MCDCTIGSSINLSTEPSIGNMKSILKILFCAIIVDFFFFSSVFTFTNGINTKLILGVLGLVTFFLKSGKMKAMVVSRQMIILTLLAVGISLASFLSMVYNNTGDDAYLTYVVSMLVWLAAAYMVVVTLDYCFGKVTIEMLADFIIALSFIQCAFAILGNMFEPVNNFIKFLYPGTGWLDTINRMYGIGDTTTLDTGGIRYSIACVLCAYMLVNAREKRKGLTPWYLLAFAFITIVGNMIARTTTVGAIIGLIYFLVNVIFGFTVSTARVRTLGWMLVIFALIIFATVWLYNTNEIIHHNLRFGFEGFFSLVEEGKWQVNSNDKLLSMYVFPDNMKTWIIGDGYFNNPYRDPNYIGDITDGYYMNTDVGYLRFIFYFGIIGLSIFTSFILYAGYLCIKRFPGNTLLFCMLVLIHFFVWFKVSTDCFFILGLFIAMAYVREYQSNSVNSLRIT